MNIVAYINTAREHQQEWIGAFVEGAKALGHKVRIMNKDIIVDCDLAVMWGHSNSWRNVIADRRKRSRDYCVMERGYIGDRFEAASLSLNGQHGEAVNIIPLTGEESEGAVDRTDQFKNLLMKPKKIDLKKAKKKNGPYVLLIGQMPTDASLNGLDIAHWLMQRAVEIDEAGYNVVYRPHPDDPRQNNGIFGLPYTKPGASLEAVMKKAVCIYTYSSNAGVDAVLAGLPVIAESPVSMVHRVAGHSVADIKKAGELTDEDRWAWFDWLVNCQWTIKEISEGKALAYLMNGINV